MKSNMRRSLFSEASSIRRKLFSESGESLKSVICNDCGYKFETSAGTTRLLCPKCGGKRFNVERRFFSPEGTPDMIPGSSEKSFSEKKISLFSEKSEEERFQRTFSETSDPFELRLKKYSGTTLNTNDCERIFGISANEMEQRGFAEVSGNTMSIPKDAFLQSRLFSKLIISVTKIMDLDPEITCSHSPMEEGISKLENIGGLNPKGIILIKKAHGVPVEGPTDMAPHEMFDELERRGIIKISGDHIDIIK